MLAEAPRVAGGAVLATLLAVASGSPAAPPAPGSPEARLIDLHVAWLGGWGALESLQDLVLHGTLQTAGLTGPVSGWQRRDGFSHTEYDLKVIRGSETVTPQRAWSVNAAGQIEDLGTSQAEEKRRLLARSFCAHLQGEGVTIHDRGPIEREGKTWEALRFTYPDSDWIELLLDPHDGGLEWSRTRVDTRETRVHLTEWRDVGGLRFPFRQESITEEKGSGQVIVWDSVQVNAGIPDDRFAPPGAVRPPVRIASGKDSTDWADLHIFQHAYLFLRGQVNGVETEMILDSGAGMTVLDRSFALAAGLRPEGEITAKGVGGSSTAGMIPGIALRVAGLEADSLTAAVIDLSQIEMMMGRSMPVIFGKEVFNNLVVDVDYPHSRIRFHNPATFRYTGPGRPVPLFAIEGGHRELEARIEDRPPARFHLDTGNGGTLDLFRYYTDELHLLEGRAPVSQRLAGGVGGTMTISIATLRSLEIGGFVLQGVPASFSRTEGGAFDTRRQAGNLGAGILSRFRVLFDYAHETLWLEPGADWDRAPFRKDRSGLSVQLAGDTLAVLFVSPGSPAEKAGWKAGEKITAVDSRPVDRTQYWDRMADWNAAPAGTEVSLTLPGGEVRRLKLEDYY